MKIGAARVVGARLADRSWRAWKRPYTASWNYRGGRLNSFFGPMRPGAISEDPMVKEYCSISAARSGSPRPISLSKSCCDMAVAAGIRALIWAASSPRKVGPFWWPARLGGRRICAAAARSKRRR